MAGEVTAAHGNNGASTCRSFEIIQRVCFIIDVFPGTERLLGFPFRFKAVDWNFFFVELDL